MDESWNGFLDEGPSEWLTMWMTDDRWMNEKVDGSWMDGWLGGSMGGWTGG